MDLEEKPVKELVIPCSKPGHNNSPILTICCNPDCEIGALNCVTCILKDN